MSCDRCTGVGPRFVICPQCRGSGLEHAHLGRDGWASFACTRCAGARVLERRAAVTLHQVAPIEVPAREEAIAVQLALGRGEGRAR